MFYLSCTAPYNQFLSPLCGRDDGEGQGSHVARTGDAESVPAAGGAGSLHDDPNREPERDGLHLWSYCKLFMQ